MIALFEIGQGCVERRIAPLSCSRVTQLWALPHQEPPSWLHVEAASYLATTAAHSLVTPRLVHAPRQRWPQLGQAGRHEAGQPGASEAPPQRPCMRHAWQQW